MASALCARRETDRLLGRLFLFCLAVLLLSHAGRIMHGDDETMYRLTRELVEAGRITVGMERVRVEPVNAPGLLPTQAYDFETSYASPGRDGLTFSKYGPGQSLLALPLYLLGRVLSGEPQVWTRLAVSLVNPLLGALTAAGLAGLALRLRHHRRDAVLLALAHTFGCMAWPYAKSFFSEPAVTLLYVLAARELFSLSPADASRRLSRAGLCLATSLLFRQTAAIGLPAFLLAALFLLRQAGIPWARPRLWLGTAAALTATLALLAGYNVLRFGSPLGSGYSEIAWDTPIWIGLIGLLLSPGKSVLLYNPILLAVPLALRRSGKPLSVLAGLLFLTYLLFHAPYNYWSGGWNWGPRFLLPALPFLILLSGELLRSADRWGRPLFLALATLGLLLTLPAVLADHSRHLIALSEQDPERFYSRAIFEPAQSPLLRQWPAASEVGRLFFRAEDRLALRTVLAGTPQITPADAASRDRAGDRLLWQAELLRLNAPDLWYIGLVQSGHLPPAAGWAAGLCLLLASGASGMRLWTALRREA